MVTLTTPETIERFSDEARRAVYDVIALRRDVRHFMPDEELGDEVLTRILGAAHLAPSVGFSQPWGFIVVRDRAIRERVRESFLRCRQAEAARYPAERREAYLAHRLEGILEASLNVCVAVDLRDRGEAILGTTVQPEAIRGSACCAVQNLWLAARAEGIGVGWVSIVEPSVLRAELALPAGVEPIAYLCVGKPLAFRAKPMLEETGWSARRPLAEAVHWGSRWVEQPREAPREARETLTTNAPPLAARRFDTASRDLARVHQRTLTKPVGSLGRLEDLATWYAGVRGVFPVSPPRCALALFAADHGIVRRGVSAYGSPLTSAMLGNVLAGGAAINVLARAHDVELVAIDVGIAGDTSAWPRAPVVPLVRAPIRAGTRDFLEEPAMTEDEVEAAMRVGARVADDMAARGIEAAGVGEIGIGNTTSAAALVCAFTGASAREACGRGTGIDDATLARKIAIVEEACARHRARLTDPRGALAAVGGLELAAIAGFVLRATEHRIAVVIDGFLTAAAALAAHAIAPDVAAHLLASHASVEPGARLALARLGLEPLLSLDLRLGEGTGAVLGLSLLRASVALQAEMATFATAGIVKP